MRLEIYRAIDGFRGRILNGDDIIFQSSDAYGSHEAAAMALRLPHIVAKDIVDEINRLLEAHHPSEYACGSLGKLARDLQTAINNL